MPVNEAEVGTKPVRVRGITCPHCVKSRLLVLSTKRPMRGLVVRYRMCSVCGHRVYTEERARPRKGK